MIQILNNLFPKKKKSLQEKIQIVSHKKIHESKENVYVTFVYVYMDEFYY